MRHRRRIRNDSIRDKRMLIAHHLQVHDILLIIRDIRTTPPHPLKHLTHSGSSTLNLTLANRLQVRNETRILHHERHQLARIAPNREELQIRLLLHKLPEIRMRRESNAMSVISAKNLANLQERLDISSTANDHDDNVQPRPGRSGMQRRRRRLRVRVHSCNSMVGIMSSDLVLAPSRNIQMMLDGVSQRFGNVPRILRLVDRDIQPSISLRHLALTRKVFIPHIKMRIPRQSRLRSFRFIVPRLLLPFNLSNDLFILLQPRPPRGILILRTRIRIPLHRSKLVRPSLRSFPSQDGRLENLTPSLQQLRSINRRGASFLEFRRGWVEVDFVWGIVSTSRRRLYPFEIVVVVLGGCAGEGFLRKVRGPFFDIRGFPLW
jgi:hypothetical protein